MKKLLIAALLAGLCCLAAADAVRAGRRHHGHGHHRHHAHRYGHAWEGLAVGLGAVIVGSALMAPYWSRPAPRAYAAPAPPPPAGRWETRRVWIPPAYERVWNPGHFDRYGNRVPGYWSQVEKTPGHWRRERVWISGW